MPKTLHCLVSGRVQGVNFRSWTKGQAEKHGVTGWVRNLANGRVEVKAQGDEQVLETFREELNRGPSAGRVDNLECNFVDEEEEYKKFDVTF